MPKFHCECGNIVDLSPVPSPDEKFLIDARDFYNLIEIIASESSKQAIDMLEEKTLSVVVCDSCGRYHVSKGNDSFEYWTLVPEQRSNL